MLSHLRSRAVVLLAAAATALSVTAIAVPAQPAAAVTYNQQCDTAGDCLNLYNGDFAVRTYDGYNVANNNISIQFLSGGGFQLRDNVHGGCLGDLNGSQYSTQMGGGQDCPSSGHGAWGTVFSVYAQCSPAGYSLWKNRHWNHLVGFAAGSNHPVYLDTTGGICLKQLGVH